MLRRRIKSALYIDFENVPLPPEAIGSWLAWLEDGAFEPSGRGRRFLEKRVYWNSHAERNRELFQRHGFAAILVGKFAGLKNGADIRMAMDIVEATYTRAEIDEFILLTGDSDFVPVLERLRQKAKRSAIVATEHRPNVHTTYHLNADILIPSRRLAEAAGYRRPAAGLLRRLVMPWRAPQAAGGMAPFGGGAPASAQRGGAGRGRGAAAPATSSAGGTTVVGGPTPAPSTLDAAARAVARLLVQQPRNYVAQRRIVAELERIPGFKRQGPAAFLGVGSYRELMLELARREARITVIEQPGGGTGVVHLPATPPGEKTQSTQVATSPATSPLPAREAKVPAATVAEAPRAASSGLPEGPRPTAPDEGMPQGHHSPAHAAGLAGERDRAATQRE